MAFNDDDYSKNQQNKMVLRLKPTPPTEIANVYMHSLGVFNYNVKLRIIAENYRPVRTFET